MQSPYKSINTTSLKNNSQFESQEFTKITQMMTVRRLMSWQEYANRYLNCLKSIYENL